MTRVGKRAKKSSLTDGENVAALLLRAITDDVSHFASGAFSASINGRPMASPVIMSELTRSCSTKSHTFRASNLGMRTILLPTKLCPMTAHCVAPCMSGAMGRNVRHIPALPFSTMSSGRLARSLVIGSMPPPRAMNTSLCRQTTPFAAYRLSLACRSAKSTLI